MAEIDWYLILGVAIGIALDVVTGIAKAYKAGDINSTAMREGILHKLCYVIVIVLCGYVDMLQDHVALDIEIPTLASACAYIIVVEVVSVIENLVEINPELSDWPFIHGIIGRKGNDE